jgi:PEP-CTERM motif
MVGVTIHQQSGGKPMKSMAYALGCALLLTATSPARAQVNASASVDHLQFTLTDLRPNDASKPALSWVQTSSDSESKYSINKTLFLSQNGSVAQYSTSFGGWASDYKNDGNLTITSANTDLVKSSANATGASTTSTLTPGDSQATSYLSGDYVLSPHTALTVTALAQVHVDGSVAPDALRPPGLGNLYTGHAFAGIIGAYGIATPVSDELRANIAENNSGMPLSDGTGRPLSLTFVNDSDNDVGGDITAYVKISTTYRVFDDVRPIPEPSTLAQMLMGMAGLVLITRRKAQGSSQQRGLTT